jgi:hypothetical protein
MSTAIDIDVSAVAREVVDKGYTIARPSGGFAALCDRARTEYVNVCRALPVQPPKKAFRPADLQTRPWRKFAIGSKNGVGEPYAQVLQTVYFSGADPAQPALNALFDGIIGLRNRLMQVADDFGADPGRDGFWNACRVHHYPRGGGFMMTHRDTYFPIKLGDLPFYQVMVPLSVKGRDFAEGGGVLVTKQDERISTDETAGLGTIVVFDGRIQHGVDDVDPQEIVNFHDMGGRLAAFANLYVTPK